MTDRMAVQKRERNLVMQMQTMDTLESLVVKHPFLSELNPHFYHFFNDCALHRRYEPGQEIFHESGQAENDV